MSKPNYRVIVTFDADRKLFLGRAPELEHCTAEGASRNETIAKLEEEIDAQLANMLSHGTTPPRSVDEEIFSGELSLKVSKNLHRDLAYQARSEGVELDHLVGELLAAAMEGRKQSHRAQRGGNRQAPEQMVHDNIGNRHDGPPRPRQGFGGRGNNMQLLDDRANFIEYVRGLEQNGGQGGQHPGHRGGGGGGGPGGDHRRRRRGGGGPGRNGGPGNYRSDNGQNRPYGNDHRAGNGAPAREAAPAAPPTASPTAGGSDGNSGSEGNR